MARVIITEPKLAELYSRKKGGQWKHSWQYAANRQKRKAL